MSQYGLRLASIVVCMVLNVALNTLLIPVLSVPGAVLPMPVDEVVLVLLAWACVLRRQRRFDEQAKASAV